MMLMMMMMVMMSCSAGAASSVEKRALHPEQTVLRHHLHLNHLHLKHFHLIMFNMSILIIVTSSPLQCIDSIITKGRSKQEPQHKYIKRSVVESQHEGVPRSKMEWALAAISR